MDRNSLFNNFGFNIGFWFGVVTVVFANYLSYLNGLEIQNELAGSTPVTGVNWGVPFKMFSERNSFFDVIYNGFIYFALCFGLGLFMKFILLKFSNSE